MKVLKVLVIGIVCIVGLFFLVFGMPIMSPNESDCTIVRGEVTNLMGNDNTFDISLFLENDDAYYYVNRGLENGLSINELEESLLHQFAEVHYVRHWSLLNFKGKRRHIARIKVGNELLYDEIN